MQIQDKLSVLARIARAFIERGISWALGASAMLYLRGVTPDFHDLDLLTTQSDFPAAQEVLAGLGTLLPPRENALYRTEHFLECVVDGVEIDLMANFTILHSGAEHRFPLEECGAPDFANVLGEAVPLQSLSLWRECYRLMGRAEKERAIDRWLDRRTPVADGNTARAKAAQPNNYKGEIKA